MKYYSTKLNSLFDTVEELEAAEKEYDAKQAEKAKLDAERKAAWNKVQDSYKLAAAQREAAEQMEKEFYEKYGKAHGTMTEVESNELDKMMTDLTDHVNTIIRVNFPRFPFGF